MKTKVSCGRYDCTYIDGNGCCWIRNIAIGKDLKCHSYKQTNQEMILEQFEKDYTTYNPRREI